MQTMSVNDIKSNAIGLWFSEDNMHFYGTELTDRAYSSNGVIWHFAYTNHKVPYYWLNGPPPTNEYRVVSWRKEKSSTGNDVYHCMGDDWRQPYHDLGEAIKAAMELAG